MVIYGSTFKSKLYRKERKTLMMINWIHLAKCGPKAWTFWFLKSQGLFFEIPWTIRALVIEDLIKTLLAPIMKHFFLSRYVIICHS